MMKSLNKFLDSVFELLINNPYPSVRVSYWKDLNSEYTTDFDDFKEFKNLSKYKLQEFINEGRFTDVDKFIMSFKPNKKQFEFLKTILNKELQLKANYKEGIRHLLKAKDIFENGHLH